MIDSISKVEELDLRSFEKNIEEKVIELVNNLTGKVIKELPKEFVKQIKEGTCASTASDTAGSFVDTGLSVSITPSSTSSKVFIIAACVGQNNTVGGGIYLRILRDSTTIYTPHTSGIVQYANVNNVSTSTLTFLDSPSTTSQVRYEYYFRRRNGSGTLRVNPDNHGVNITAMEIAQ